ncbi:hypothetical protein SAMN04488066_104169 [Halorubrum aquaticum]|uniref:Uncharacterized protein n=1 Tax=Halorubrum aquaticum TaxID=387340 RepID=A0A1I3A5B7_9EURY|nr:hypothetical protein SAMN04488066_104169 [Halorubrum aquaticum]
MSETVFAMLKDDGDEICSRSWHGQFRELTRKCIVHYLEQAASLTRRLLSSPNISGRGIAIVHLMLYLVSCETDALVAAQFRSNRIGRSENLQLKRRYR